MKNRVLFIIADILLFLVIYIMGSKICYGEVYFLNGNNNKSTLQTESLQEVSKDFQLQEDGSFLSVSPDPWFDIKEDFSVKTIIINIESISDIYDSQIFYYSDNFALNEERSYYFRLKEGTNYIQIPNGGYNLFRLDLTDHTDVNLKIDSIIVYGNRVLPSIFLFAVVGIWIIISLFLYRYFFKGNLLNTYIDNSSCLHVSRNHKEKKKVGTRKNIKQYIFYFGCLIVLIMLLISCFNKHAPLTVRIYYGELHQEGKAQIFYWTSNDELSEKKSISVPLDGKSAVEFNLGRIDYDDTYLRIDPTDIQEKLSIERVEFCTRQKTLDMSGREFMSKVLEVYDCEWYFEEDAACFLPSNTDLRMTISLSSINLSQASSDILDIVAVFIFMLLEIMFTVMIYSEEGDYKWEKFCGGIIISALGSRIFLKYMRIPFYGIVWILFAGVLFYFFYSDRRLQQIEEKVGYVGYSLIFCIAAVLGYHIQTNFNLYFGTKMENYIAEYSVEDLWALSFLVPTVLIILKGAGYLLEKLSVYVKPTNNVKIQSRKRWLLTSAIIFALWLPYLLTYYPGMIFGDSLSSIYQALGQAGWNNHHPLAYTFFIKVCLKIGIAIKDINFGCCIYSLVQMAYVALCLGYLVCWLWNKGISKKAGCVIIAFYVLSPFFASNGIAMWKDPIFSATICVWTLIIFDFVIFKSIPFDKKFVFKNILFIFLICFVRNNGIYIVAFVEATLLLISIIKRKEVIAKKFKKPIIGMGIIILIIMFITGPLYTRLGVAGEPVESLGIFLNQMARVAAYDGNMDENDKEFMDNLLPLERYADTYIPCVVDRLKWDSEFSQTYLNEHVDLFWKTYFSMLMKNPGHYIKAWELNTFGYWAVNFWELNFNRQNITSGDLTCIYTWDNCGIVPKNLLYGWVKDSEKIFPLDDAMPALAIINWFVLLCCVLAFSKKKLMYGIALAPSVGLIITLLIGTPHAYWQRYGLACYYLLPFYLYIIVMLMRKEDSTI